MRRAGIALGLAAWAGAAPPAGAADQATLGARSEPGGTLLGRVCLDLDGDGACGAGEPGVAGARVLAAAGQVALADPHGRFHFLDVPARVLAGDRVAYGGQRLAVEGFPASRALVDLAPDGAAPVILVVSAPAPRLPRLEAAGVPGAPPRREKGRLHWSLGGRTEPGSTVAIDGAHTVAAADGSFALEVVLAPGDNPFGVALATADGRAALLRWVVHLAPRASGGDLVLPGRPEPLASFAATPAGGGALVHGSASPGTKVRVEGLAAAPEAGGAFAAYARVGPARPPAGAEATVEVALDDGRGAPVTLALPVGAGRDLTVAALGEVEVSFGGSSDVVVTGRGTGAVRGRLGAVEVEAGVDLDDRDRALSDLARPRDALTAAHALDPERTFLTAGDDGAADDANAARGRLWAHLTAPGARLDLGNARSSLAPERGGELGRYDRSFFGARAEGAGDVGPLRLEASAFGATLRADAGGNAPPRPGRDALAAHGGAFYWLSSSDLVPGSEVVRVEWRDPFTGLATGRRTLVRTLDYEIDWVSGRIALARPLPSVAPPAAVETGAPTLAAGATLVVEYLHAAAQPGAEDLQGGRAGATWGPAAVEARVANEERPGAGYRMEAGAASIDLGVIALRAEAARSHGDPGGAGVQRSQDGGFAFSSAAGRDGEAVHLEARGAAGPASYAGWWRERGAGYADGTFQALTDEHERGASVDVDLGAWGGGVTYADRAGADPAAPVGAPPQDARRLVARGRWTGESIEVVAEGVYSERTAPTREEATSVGARATWHLDPRLALDLSHHQGLSVTGAGADPTFTAAGASLEVGRSRLDVRGGWGPDTGPRLIASGEHASGGETVYGTFTADPDATPFGAGATATGAGSAAALGARRRAGGTEVFTEENVGRDLLGLRTARVFGLAIEPAAGLRMALTGERGVRLGEDGGEVDRTAVAGSAGLSVGPTRFGVRGELRREGVGRADAAGGSLDWRAAERLTLSARTAWSDGDLGGVKAHLLEVSAGGALRLDRGGLLATVSRLDEQRPGASRRQGVVGRLAATADLGARVAVGAALAVAVQEVADAREDRLVGSVRASVRVVGPLDVGAEAARRGPLGEGDVGVRSALRAEVGLRLGTGLAASEGRLALGWQVVGFTGDGLAPRDEAGRLFLRAQLAY